MVKLCIFAGTTEGRTLAEFLSTQPVELTACVATEYGQTLLPRKENVTVSANRLTRQEMEAMFLREGFSLVVDATHPYAQAVTENIVSACEAARTPYLRVLREEEATADGAVFVEDMEQAARFLDKTEGNILLTTGSKELAALTGIRNFSQRCYARVLPMDQSLALCREAGLQPSHIIAMQGPFSEALNRAMLESVAAAWMLTKQSGAAGGYEEKLAAARSAGARAVVIGRPPQREGLSCGEAVRMLCSRFGLTAVPEVTVVGIGPGSRSEMTAEALEAMEQAECLIGASRMLEAAPVQKPGFSATKPEKIAGFIRENPQYQRFAVLMSGDSGFYSGTRNLLPLLKDCRVSVLPGISSLSCLCARTGLSYEDIVPMSLHGREGDLPGALRRHGKVFVLVGGENGLGKLCASLTAAGMGGARVYAGEQLGYAGEVIARGMAAELAEKSFHALSAAIFLWDGPGEVVSGGLPDEIFCRDEAVPMTKSEVRAVCLSKLQLEQTSICWDVGAGTGSVALEMGRLAWRGQVYAVEKKPEALALLEENRKRLGLLNVTAIPGTAPEALEALPAPTHVFIGGSGGHLRQILELALKKNPNVRIVATAIALETAGILSEQMKAFPQAEAVSLTVARARRAGPYHLMTGQNPIHIFTLQKGGEQK